MMHNFLARVVYLLKGPNKTNAFLSGRTLNNENVKVDVKIEGCFHGYGRFTNIFKLPCTTIFLLFSFLPMNSESIDITFEQHL